MWVFLICSRYVEINKIYNCLWYKKLFEIVCVNLIVSNKNCSIIISYIDY